MYRVTVEPVVFMYSVSYTVQLSVQQDFIFSRICNEHYSKETCALSWESGVAEKVRWVQAEAVKYVMVMSVITGLVGTVASQLLGAALDRYSQKTVMASPFMGLLMLNMVCVVVAALPTAPLQCLYLGALLNGLCGAYAVFKSSVSSYVVRTAMESARTSRLAVVEGMLLLGSAIGPLVLRQCLVSSATSDLPHQYLFLGSEGVIAVATLYILLILPDHLAPRPLPLKAPLPPSSLPLIPSDDTARPKHSCDRVKAPMKDLVSGLKATVRKRSGGRRTALILLLVADFFIAIVFAAEFDLLYLYMQDQLGFTLAQYSLYLALKNIVNGVSLLLVLPSLRRYLHLSDLALGVMGGISRAAAFTLLALNVSHTLVYIVPFVDVFGQYLFVVLRSQIASLVDEEEQGRVLTVTASLAQLSLLAGSLIFDNVYPTLLSIHHPGYTFIIAAASMTVATVILGYIQCQFTRSITREERQPLIQ